MLSHNDASVSLALLESLLASMAWPEIHTSAHQFLTSMVARNFSQQSIILLLSLRSEPDPQGSGFSHACRRAMCKVGLRRKGPYCPKDPQFYAFKRAVPAERVTIDSRRS